MFENVSWEAIGSVCTIIGATYVFSRNLRNDIKKDMKEDMEKFERRMEIIDGRWASLFEKFHILDKDMEKFRIGDKRHS